MKRLFFVPVILIVLIFSSCTSQYSKLEKEYFDQINAMIRDEDFFTAEVSDSKIILFDSEFHQTEEIMFDDYDQSIRLIRIRKNGDLIFFITSGSVDDEQGVMYVNNDANSILDGVKSLNRIGGNSYRYSTAE